jgi:hypothetical protein
MLLTASSIIALLVASGSAAGGIGDGIGNAGDVRDICLDSILDDCCCANSAIAVLDAVILLSWLIIEGFLGGIV